MYVERARLTASSHHHHHHEDQGGILKRIATPSQSTPNSMAGNYHHHHHHRHHHHPTPKPQVYAPVALPRVLTTIVESKSVLESVQRLPRHHLGSTLYSPSAETHPGISGEGSGRGSRDKPKQLPRFEGKENCTFTIRIPRYYLSDAERERICGTRAMWGTEIYTDDSDPLAAAIHSGWIRGEWGAEIDATMLEINPTTRSSIDAGKSRGSATMDLTYSSQPPEPLRPIPGKDLHLTLLILPTLQSYASCVRHGIKSRAWGNTHDGMSFIIDKATWVDGGAGKAEERGGEARRKRMKTLASWQSMATGPALRLKMWDTNANGMAPTAVTT